MKALLVFAILLSASLAWAEFNVTRIREVDTSVFTGYPEIGEIRQNLLLAYYSRDKDSLPPGFPEFADASLDFMKKFGIAYNLSTTDDPERLLKMPEEIGLAASSLWTMEGLASDSVPLSKYNAYLARTAAERYISTEAERLKRLAEGEAQTKKKLAYYEAAAGTFNYSGTGVRAAEMRATYESISATYNADMEKADSIFRESKTLCKNSIEGSKEWFGLLAYVGLRRCTAGLREARNTYVAHLEGEKLSELDGELSVASLAENSLSSAVLWFFAALCFVFLLLNGLVISKIRVWREDDYDSSLGSEVLKWKGRA